MVVFLAVPQLVTGAWAILRPAGWFADFPGIGPALVAAEPPFNRHLATDAGAGFLAIGVCLAVAVVFGWSRRVDSRYSRTLRSRYRTRRITWVIGSIR